MIIDKKSGSVISGNSNSTLAPTTDNSEVVAVPEQMPQNGIIEVCKAIMEILSNVRWEWGNEHSEKIFKTVQWDDGQFERIVKKGRNEEYEIAFPAVFVHFTDTYYLVQQSRIGQGRANLRIRFVLNRLNTHDKEHQLDGLYVSQRIDQEIQEHKNEYDCLADRC